MKFKPERGLIRLAEAVLVAMAHEQVVRPIVEEYQRKVMAKYQFRIARDWVARGMEDVVILNPKDTYLLSDEDAAVVFADFHAARDAAKLKVERAEDCPLLVAENLRIMAENALLEELGKLPGLAPLASGFLTLKHRAKAIDLGLKLLAPFMTNSDTILSRYAARPMAA